MTEWRNIDGWPRHQVSSDGRVRIATKALRGPDPHVINQEIGKVGYPVVHLYGNGSRKRVYVHTLVCEAFHGPAPTSKHEVGHGDGSRTNNSAANLRWVTRKENCDDAERHGTRLRGERQNGAKLTPDKVREIRARVGAGEQQQVVAEQFGVSAGAVWHVVRRNTWRHIP